MITFPTDPANGQEYVALNGATYTWLGNRWSSVVAIINGTTGYVHEGGDAYTWDDTNNSLYDKTLDGGTA